MKEAQMNHGNTSRGMSSNNGTTNGGMSSRGPLRDCNVEIEKHGGRPIYWSTGSNAGEIWIPAADAQQRKQEFLSRAVKQPDGGVDITVDEFCIYLGDFLEMDLDWSGVCSCTLPVTLPLTFSV